MVVYHSVLEISNTRGGGGFNSYRAMGGCRVEGSGLRGYGVRVDRGETCLAFFIDPL